MHRQDDLCFARQFGQRVQQPAQHVTLVLATMDGGQHPRPSARDAGQRRHRRPCQCYIAGQPRLHQ